MNLRAGLARHPDLYNVINLALMCLLMAGVTLLLRNVVAPNADAASIAGDMNMGGMDMSSVVTMTASAPVGLADISIQGSAFDPPGLEIPVGTTVRWTNLDAVAHTVTSDIDLFDSGNLSQGQYFEFTFDTQGTYLYRSTLQPDMQAAINVVAPAADTTRRAVNKSAP